MTDVEIIQHILAGAKEHYGELVEKYQGFVLTVIRTSLFEAEYEVEDIAQEVFFKAFRSLKQYRGEASFSSWLYRITMNCIFDFHRQKKKTPVTYELFENSAAVEAVAMPDIQAISREQQLSIRYAISKLPDSYRQMLFLHHYQGFSYTDIAAKLDLPVKTVDTRIYRAKKALRRILEEVGEVWWNES